MTSGEIRPRIAMAVIVLTVIGGAAVLVLSPLESRLDRAERVLETAKEAASEVQDSAFRIARAQAEREKVNERLAWIHMRSEESGASSVVYGHLMALSEEAGVRLDRMQPSRSDAQDGVVSHGYSFSAIGSFDDVAQFVGAINNQIGFSETVSVRMTPNWSKDQAAVQASIETRHFAFSPDGADAVVQVDDEDDS